MALKIAKKAQRLAATISDLKKPDLELLSTLTGIAKSGTRPEIIKRLEPGLQRPRIKWSGNHVRVISIDMGIRNLAYCVVDARIEHNVHNTVDIDILEWKRVDLTRVGTKTTDQSEDLMTDASETIAEVKSQERKIFHPPELAVKAYELIKHRLLPHKPDIVLIERQYFRSASSSAVQEWTLRVNMLESMLWSVLETLRREHQSQNTQNGFNIEIFDVAPKAVGQFWVREPPLGDSDSLKKSKKKIEKGHKIATLLEWIDEATPEGNYAILPTILGNPPTIGEAIKLQFFPQANRVREAFCSPRSKEIKTITKKDPDNLEQVDLDMKKRDDLADAFLQMAAWFAWEQNRLKIQGMLESNQPAHLIVDELSNGYNSVIGSHSSKPRKTRSNTANAVGDDQESAVLEEESENDSDVDDYVETPEPRKRRSRKLTESSDEYDEALIGDSVAKRKTKTKKHTDLPGDADPPKP